jgi:hypothetical protein
VGESTGPFVMFNAKKFLTATRSMTSEQVGAIIDNLCDDVAKDDAVAVLSYSFVDSFHPQKQAAQ